MLQKRRTEHQMILINFKLIHTNKIGYIFLFMNFILKNINNKFFLFNMFNNFWQRILFKGFKV